MGLVVCRGVAKERISVGMRFVEAVICESLNVVDNRPAVSADMPLVRPQPAAKLLSRAKGGGSAISILRALAAQTGVRGLPKRALAQAADQIEVLSRGIVAKRLDHWFAQLNETVGLLERLAEGIDSTRTPTLAAAWRFYVRAGEACGTAERFLRAFAGGESDNGVTLATFHASKGLEWPYVFIFGAGEHDLEGNANRIAEPILAAGVCNGGIEEERRLLHVAMIRAKKFLSVTWEGPVTAASSHIMEAEMERG